MCLESRRRNFYFQIKNSIPTLDVHGHSAVKMEAKTSFQAANIRLAAATGISQLELVIVASQSASTAFQGIFRPVWARCVFTANGSSPFSECKARVIRYWPDWSLIIDPWSWNDRALAHFKIVSEAFLIAGWSVLVDWGCEMTTIEGKIEFQWKWWSSLLFWWGWDVFEEDFK